ncbi:hypothetical protein WJX81_008296 [Elliptochloris bilobata]|uniref:PLOD1-3-like GT domain-containing protein n=1 Tax=Elliptochloris bilobata TaxID=381761 RepID=A0AAW1RLL0_9CHLO
MTSAVRQRATEEDDVILFVDALDVVFFPCHRDLLAEFWAFNADIVFQADDIEWPEYDNLKFLLFPAPPPGAHQKFRLLCAGAFMVRAGALRHYLSQEFLGSGNIDNRAWDNQQCTR